MTDTLGRQDPAEYHGHADVVEALLAGADPAVGSPSAIATAQMFGQTELLALFEQH